MKSFYYTLSSVALSVAIFALAAPASAQGRRPSGHGGGNDRPRQSMQQQAPSSNRSAAAPQARPSAPSSRSAATPQTRPSSNRPSYSTPGGDNRPRGGGNHGGGNFGGGRNHGNDNKGYQNQRPNANPGRPMNNTNFNNRSYTPSDQINKGNSMNPRPGNQRPGNGGNQRPGGNNGNQRPGNGDNYRPGGNNGGGNVNPGNGNHRPGGNNGGGNVNPGNGNHRPGGNNGGNNGNNYRPGNSDNHRPGGGHSGNYRPDNNRPGGGHGNEHRPGGGPSHHRPGGPHHGGINHGGPRPDYNRYRWHSDVRPRGPRDRWYDYYRHNRWSWRAPIAPPYRQWRPRIVWYYRPIIPTGYRYYVSAPIISGVLGLEFGTYLDASLNYLYYNGYDIDGYQDNVVYLRDVNMMGYSWPDVMLQYDSNGGMYYAEFVTSTSYQDDYRFRSLYNSLCTTFGTPINSGNGHFSWYGRNGSGFVNLNTMYDGGRFFTVLTFGV